MVRRRLAAGAALVATAVLVLSGCGSSSGSGSGGGGGNGSVTIKLVGADYGTGSSDSTTKYWQKIADAFHKKNPSITVQASTINWNDYDTKVKTQLQNHDYPDILQGEFFPDYATDKLIAPASDAFPNPTGGVATFKKQFSVDGTQYALPFTTSARALFYNKKAFAAAGINSPPQTWDELEQDAAKLKAKGYIGYGLALGPEEAQAESYLWMLGNGGGWQTDGKYTINSKQNIETFQFLKDLVSKGLTNPNPATYNRTANSAADFAAGKIGMEFNGPPLIATITSVGKLSKNDYATAPIPGKTGPVKQTLGVADAIQVFKTNDSKKADAIKKFLTFALNNTNQLAFARQYSLLPGMTAALDTLANDPVLGSFVKTLPNTVLYPDDANWTATVLPAIKRTIGTAATGNPAQVLGDLQDKTK